MDTNNLTFSVMTDVVVTGSNPENADYDNPQGHYFGFAAYVVATNERGERRRLRICTKDVESDALARATSQAAALNARFGFLHKLPVNFESWEETWPEYGSEAFSNDEMREWENNVYGEHGH